MLGYFASFCLATLIQKDKFRCKVKSKQQNLGVSDFQKNQFSGSWIFSWFWPPSWIFLSISVMFDRKWYKYTIAVLVDSRRVHLDTKKARIRNIEVDLWYFPITWRPFWMLPSHVVKDWIIAICVLCSSDSSELIT